MHSKRSFQRKLYEVRWQEGMWKYLPSWELAGRANRSPTELSAWAAAQWGADSPGEKGYTQDLSVQGGLGLSEGNEGLAGHKL